MFEHFFSISVASIIQKNNLCLFNLCKMVCALYSRTHQFCITLSLRKYLNVCASFYFAQTRRFMIKRQRFMIELVDVAHNNNVLFDHELFQFCKYINQSLDRKWIFKHITNILYLLTGKQKGLKRLNPRGMFKVLYSFTNIISLNFIKRELEFVTNVIVTGYFSYFGQYCFVFMFSYPNSSNIPSY